MFYKNLGAKELTENKISEIYELHKDWKRKNKPRFYRGAVPDKQHMSGRKREKKLEFREKLYSSKFEWEN